MIDVRIICYLVSNLLGELVAASMWWYQILQEAFSCGRPSTSGWPRGGVVYTRPDGTGFVQRDPIYRRK